MQKIKELIREVYHYEKKTEIETRYLSNVLLWFCLMVFLINLFNNGMKKNPGIYIFCLVVCVIGVWDAFHIRTVKNVELPVKVVTILLLVSSVYCIYFGGNDGFQNLWFFIAPSILLLLVGLPFGVPCCVGYGVVITVLFWSPLCEKMAYPYAWDYRFYYPVFYWSFFLLMLVTDLLFKKYRIEQEREQDAMEAAIWRDAPENRFRCCPGS